jgi:dipeptidyl aminopeptidase/acylaminoacyl peptidase
MLAYCGDFQRGGSWYHGVPMSGSIWVVESASDAPPLRISHPGDGALEPQWSPDGTRVLYQHIRSGSYTLFVAAADGSGVIRVHEEPAGLHTAAWAPAGDAIYAATDEGIRLIAADGSGLIEDMGGDERDSVPDPDQQVEMDRALSALQEAIFQYAVGNLRRFEGSVRDAKAAFHAADSIFAGIVWEYPLSQLSAEQLLLYADRAATEAAKSRTQLLTESCRERLAYLKSEIVNCAAGEDTFPSTLAEIEEVALRRDTGTINWISHEDKQWVKLFFRCPNDGHFAYTPPAAGDPEVGHVIVTCPNHPENSVAWTEELGRRLSWHREVAARDSAEHK